MHRRFTMAHMQWTQSESRPSILWRSVFQPLQPSVTRINASNRDNFTQSDISVYCFCSLRTLHNTIASFSRISGSSSSLSASGGINISRCFSTICEMVFGPTNWPRWHVAKWNQTMPNEMTWVQLNEHMQTPYEITLTKGAGASSIREQSGRRLRCLSDTKTNPVERGAFCVASKSPRKMELMRCRGNDGLDVRTYYSDYNNVCIETKLIKYFVFI